MAQTHQQSGFHDRLDRISAAKPRPVMAPAGRRSLGGGLLRRLLGSLGIVVVCGLLLKVAALVHLPDGAYQAKLQSYADTGGIQQAAVYLLRPDPLTSWLQQLIARD